MGAPDILREIAQQLDENIFPRIKNGGIVTPSDLTVPSNLGEEKHNGNKRRSATRPWQGPERRQGPPGRSRSSGAAASLFGAGTQACYEDLDAVHRAYPGTKVWPDDAGLWLLSRSSLLPDLQEAAIFLTGVSYRQAMIRSWGFWLFPCSNPAWIGPRHTNFPDGSICAFEPTDGTWFFGDPLVTLLDFYTLWALRHLHLNKTGRWPGRQAVHHSYERLLELRPDEFCGCSKSGKLYRDCCREKDLNRDRVADAVDFLMRTGGGSRKPPNSVRKFAQMKDCPPMLAEVFGG
jgi:hypothetical protein